MKIGTWNVNGVRKRKDEVLRWLAEEQPDVACLQEIKASAENVPRELAEQPEYWSVWHGNKGYSGVALLLKKARFEEPPVVAHPAFDFEARIVTATAGDRTFASTYVPNGGKDFAAKMQYLKAFEGWARELATQGASVVVCGDFNVARTPMDVHPTERGVKIGQLPEERLLLEGFLPHRLVDLVRHHHPEDDRLYSWWAPWRNMREKNIGWRLDFVVADAGLAERAVACDVQKSFGTSDHAPVIARFED